MPSAGFFQLIMERDYIINFLNFSFMNLDFKLETYEGKTFAVATLAGELLTLGNKPLANSKGTGYYLTTIKFINHLKQNQTVTAMLYEGNAQHGVEKGVSYLTKVIISEENPKPLYIMSHLPRGSESTLEDLGFSMDMFATLKANASEVADFEKAIKK
jgi:hypothetical protein